MGFGQPTQSIVTEIFGNLSVKLTSANDDGSIPPDFFSHLDSQDPARGIGLVLIETDESQIGEDFDE